MEMLQAGKRDIRQWPAIPYAFVGSRVPSPKESPGVKYSLFSVHVSGFFIQRIQENVAMP